MVPLKLGVIRLHFVAAIFSAPMHHCLTYFVMGGTSAQLSVGKVSLPGHFDLPVDLGRARPLGKGFECRLRRPTSSHYP
jgi:hypothetical protein